MLYIAILCTLCLSPQAAVWQLLTLQQQQQQQLSATAQRHWPRAASASRAGVVQLPPPQQQQQLQLSKERQLLCSRWATPCKLGGTGWMPAAVLLAASGLSRHPQRATLAAARHAAPMQCQQEEPFLQCSQLLQQDMYGLGAMRREACCLSLCNLNAELFAGWEHTLCRECFQYPVI